MSINVVKRNGSKEPLDISKLSRVVSWACEDITGVSQSEIELNSQLRFYNNIKSTDIQETLIKASADLITEDTPNYQYVAGRLINYHIRKEVYNGHGIPHIRDHIEKVVKTGYYTKELLETGFTSEEFDTINSFIDHDRDFNIVYAGMEQFRNKYLIKNRNTGEFFETPQMAFILIAILLFKDYPKETRLSWIKKYYDAISTFDISLPTPVMAGLRTPDKQFSSCVLVETADNLDSIIATAGTIIKYVSKRAGIGIGAGALRAIGSPIRGGVATHTGDIAFYRLFQSAVKSCSQGGIRGGSATLYYPWWHYEVEDFLVLKNNKGTQDNRLRQMDYCIQFNKLAYERLISGGNISLFSPSDVPGLYEAFFADQDEFIRLYEKAERNTRIRKKTIPAITLFSSFIQERKDTGRVYLMNVDNVNDQGPFYKKIAPIRMSNLCTEIDLPTVPQQSLDDQNAEVALCTLSGINWGKIKRPHDFALPCELAVRGLDSLLSYQNYEVAAAENATMKRRPLGIGPVNLAYFLAKNDMTYSDPDLEKLQPFVEAWSYYLIKASNDLAKEFGRCPGSDETKYSTGWVPIDSRKPAIDELVVHDLTLDWLTLRNSLANHGIRNSTLMAGFPAETSALVSNSTNGFEPIPALITSKQSKDGSLKQVAPEMKRLGKKYELKFDQQSPEGYLKICALFQKYMDQGISVNTTYNPVFYENEEIPLSILLKDVIFFYKYGGKQLYYLNQNDVSGEIEAPLIDGDTEDDEFCEGCAL